MTTFTSPTRRTDRAAGLHYAEPIVRPRTVLACGSRRRWHLYQPQALVVTSLVPLD